MPTNKGEQESSKTRHPMTVDGLKRELAQLIEARRHIRRAMRYNGVVDALEKAGLPYKLVQDTHDMSGEPLSWGYRYRFTSDWNGPAILYIQETPAGRQHKTMNQAMDTLGWILERRIAAARRKEAT